MPWDSLDKRRDEDSSERRKTSRRRFRRGGHRSIDFTGGSAAAAEPWEESWRRLLAAKGYELRSASYEIGSGWTLWFVAPDGELHRFDAPGTLAVQSRIAGLPQAEAPR